MESNMLERFRGIAMETKVAVGSKERAFGALNQDRRDHKCGDSVPAERLPS